MGRTATLGCLNSSFDSVLVRSSGGRCCDLCGPDLVHAEFLPDLAQGSTNDSRDGTCVWTGHGVTERP